MTRIDVVLPRSRILITRISLTSLFVFVLIGSVPKSYSTVTLSPTLPMNSPGFALNFNSAQSEGSSLNTQIVSAVDGTGGIVNLGGSTSSNSITFTFQVIPSGTNLFDRFECSLDGNLFILCESPKTYTGLSVGSHIFQVRAVDSTGEIETSPAEWTWTVLAAGLTGTVLSPNNAVQNSATNQIENTQNQALVNSAVQAGNTANAQTNAQNVQLADSQAQALNPVLKVCDPNTSDYAIYDINGQADLTDLLTNGPGITSAGSKISGSDLPISLMIFNDQKPTDRPNQIINNIQPFLKGVLVAYPGDISNQRTTPFEITRITTDCVRSSFQSEEKVLEDDGRSTAEPDLTIRAPNLNPIFGFCNTAPGNVAIGDRALAPLSTGIGPDAGVVIASNVGGTTSQQQQFNNELTSNAGLAAASNTAAIQNPTANTVGGAPVDVIKYTVKGNIESISLPNDVGQQDLTFRVFSVFNPDEQLPGNLVRTGDTNNKWLAAKIEIEPGNQDEWQSLILKLNEIETRCGSVPFVDSPKTIGTQSQEFYTVPVTND